MTIESDVLVEYKNFVTESFEAFIPIFSVVIGIFLAFAIANSARFLIQKMIKK